MKKLIALLLALVMILGLVACGAKDAPAADAPAADTPAADAPAASGEKVDLKFYANVVEYVSGPLMSEAMKEKLADKYNIDAIQVDWSNLDKVVRTGIASGDPCDVYCIDTGMVKQFADAAVDLTPYLEADPEWYDAVKDCLAPTTIDGKVYGITWELNFPVMLANKTVLDAAGVEIPESWTYAELAEACKKLQDYGVFPIGHATDMNRADWMWRYAMSGQTTDSGTNEAYVNFELPMDGDDNVKVLETIKSLYDNNYMYPGEGAVTVKVDEVKAAFAQGKVAIITEIAAGSKVTADAMKEAGIDVVAIPWPSMGETRVKMGTGGNALFVPANSKHIDEAVEMIKVFTSAEVQAIHAREGYVSINKNVVVDDPFVQTLLAQTAGTPCGFPVFTAEWNEYKGNNLLADLILNGGVDVVTEKMEQIRLNALEGE